MSGKSTKAKTARTVTIKSNKNQPKTKDITHSKKYNLLEDRADISRLDLGPLEIQKHLHNIRLILLNSNATPIKHHTTSGFSCHFCSKSFVKPADLKQHTLENHVDSQKEKFMSRCSLFSYVVKLDITGLECLICHTGIDSLQELVDHLQNDHGKEYFTDINNHILPFKFENENIYVCVLCPNIYWKFKQMHEHMSAHYSNYTCDICNRPYVNKHSFQEHRKRHEIGEYKCSYCSKVFPTAERKWVHQRQVHLGGQRRNKCPHCPAKFVCYHSRNRHMVEEHGAEQVIYKCFACDKTFTKKSSLSQHTRRDHLLERTHECKECDGKFFEEKHLKEHMLKHTGEKRFQCSHCLKGFGRKTNLREHIRIHMDDRRFKCEKCGQTFVQKCSWRSHLRTRHGVVT